MPGNPGSAAQRRGLLASLAAIQVQRPKLVVLEDWMEEPSQEEARNLLGSLQGGVEALPLARRESRNQMAGLLESFQRQLQVDHDFPGPLVEPDENPVVLGVDFRDGPHIRVLDAQRADRKSAPT